MSVSGLPQRATRCLSSSFKRLRINPEAAPTVHSPRKYATVTETPVAVAEPLISTPSPPSTIPTISQNPSPSLSLVSAKLPPSIALERQAVPVTLYSWPEFEPLRHKAFPHDILAAPFRRDLLHRAVVFEGSNTRRGTASTKTRWEVAYARHAKIRPQKGTGQARLKDRGNPILRGGGVSHGPRPRDFSNDLPAQMYHAAFRTALSYRYIRGQITVLRDEISVPSIAEVIEDNQLKVSRSIRWLNNVFTTQDLNQSSSRTTLIVTMPKDPEDRFRTAMERLEFERKTHAQRYDQTIQRCKWRDVDSVDVKNILEAGRVVIEEKALWRLCARNKPRK